VCLFAEGADVDGAAVVFALPVVRLEGIDVTRTGLRPGATDAVLAPTVVAADGRAEAERVADGFVRRSVSIFEREDRWAWCVAAGRAFELACRGTAIATSAE
jgi:hypothetical protein